MHVRNTTTCLAKEAGSSPSNCRLITPRHYDTPLGSTDDSQHSGVINGNTLGADRDRLAEACKQGASSMFGSGVNPGFAELLAIVIANICDRIDKVTVIEAADTTLYDSPVSGFDVIAPSKGGSAPEVLIMTTATAPAFWP